MQRFLADENVPLPIVEAIRSAGFDVMSVCDTARSIDDEDVLALAVNESRILITFDKDFGELVFHAGAASCGIILIRPRSLPPDELVRTIVTSLCGDWTWAGQLTVIDGQYIRFRRLP